MIKVPEGIEIEEIPMEKRYRSSLSGLLARIRILYEAIEDRFGEEGLQLIREVSCRYGQQIAQRVREREGEMDMQQVGKFLIKVFDGMRAEGEVLEWSDERIIIMVPKCPYPFTRSQICAAHTAMEEALVHGLNPTLHYNIEKCIPRGDKECWHVLSRATNNKNNH
ncbi:MAG: hypothetical protein A2Y62_20275 [Candidatus Fischerbacteria bacterium RBG_13_37_8]|uniref:Metanogen output domain-containing protein n=1 Tax=Candidatus Fischerbacteria bacterium RBG_13_37_8 TaxID=1817863 RepID=A0A1F5VFD9_9BACT|nr:MAG: hypothetical protein A2Y62_20275 [Candidatus Fischerbacteria bacterium RBG_13_37_8]